MSFFYFFALGKTKLKPSLIYLDDFLHTKVSFLTHYMLCTSINGTSSSVKSTDGLHGHLQNQRHTHTHNPHGCTHEAVDALRNGTNGSLKTPMGIPDELHVRNDGRNDAPARESRSACWRHRSSRSDSRLAEDAIRARSQGRRRRRRRRRKAHTQTGTFWELRNFRANGLLI